jgi:hypothetical protein
MQVASACTASAADIANRYPLVHQDSVTIIDAEPPGYSKLMHANRPHSSTAPTTWGAVPHPPRQQPQRYPGALGTIGVPRDRRLFAFSSPFKIRVRPGQIGRYPLSLSADGFGGWEAP